MEETVQPGKPGAASDRKRSTARSSSPHSIDKIEIGEHVRVSTGIGELDRVLGGGIIPGTSVLVGGEPGIGKSTLMLQMACQVSRRNALYVTGEENERQIKVRADRLGVSNQNVSVLAESRLEEVLNAIQQGHPPYNLVVVDSIQTVYSPEAGAVPGTPNQIKYSAFELSDWAKQNGAAVFFVAHVTKEGSIAGPKTIEHMVDTVLYFEQSDDSTRFLRASKNRFGSTDEIGLFTMQGRGLVQITDPSSVFLVRREKTMPVGVVVAPVIEGSRVILVEVQALTVPAKSGVSRVFSDRLDSRRVSRVAAVLEKHLGLPFSDQDLYVNVAGGMRIRDVGVELALAVALYGARTDRTLPAGTTVTGEVSLAGEVRPVAQMARRARTGVELGLSRCIGPESTREGEESGSGSWVGVNSLEQAIREIFGSTS